MPVKPSDGYPRNDSSEDVFSTALIILYTHVCVCFHEHILRKETKTFNFLTPTACSKVAESTAKVRTKPLHLPPSKHNRA